jgi:hypothetical protein
MASNIIVLFKWDGLTQQHYEKVMSNLGTDIPKGQILHCAGFHNNGLRVTDVWETVNDFDAFVQTRLMPIVSTLGIEGEPNIEIFPLSNLLSK